MGEIFVTAMTNMFPQTGHFALAVGGSSNFFEYAVSISPRLFEGLKMTIAMTVCSLILGILVGLLSCFCSISKSFILNKLSGAYLSIIRGTPLMVQATFIYFGLSAALNMPITSFTASIIVLMLNSGAYLSEIFRSGISAINKGQMEAARSLGAAPWRSNAEDHSASGIPYRYPFRNQPVHHHTERYVYPVCYRCGGNDASEPAAHRKQLPCI